MEEDDYLGYDDPERIRDIIYWTTLALRLPSERIDVVFPTEDACRERLIAVRWPEGVKCPFCEASGISELTKRRLFRCGSCRAQFSATSGTLLHSTHVSTLLWFAAAQKLIRTYASTACVHHVSGRALAKELGRSYRTAVRVKEILLKDIEPSGPGLVRESVCTDHFSLPNDLDLGSELHAAWLQITLVEQGKWAW